MALTVAVAITAMLIADVSTADASGGMKVTLSLGSPAGGGCSIELDAAWSHPKRGQTKLELQAFDTTTGHLTTVEISDGISPFDQAGATDFPGDAFFVPANGPDVWIGKAMLFDGNNKLLAQTSSKSDTLDCSL